MSTKQTITLKEYRTRLMSDDIPKVISQETGVLEYSESDPDENNNVKVTIKENGIVRSVVLVERITTEEAIYLVEKIKAWKASEFYNSIADSTD